MSSAGQHDPLSASSAIAWPPADLCDPYVAASPHSDATTCTISGTTIIDIAQLADSLYATTPVDDAAHSAIDGTRLNLIVRTSNRCDRPGTSADVGPIG